MSITHPELVKALAKSGADICSTMEASEAHILHMAVGVSGEVFELLGAIVEDDRDNALEELGDIEFYFEGLCQGTDAVIARTVVDPKTLVKDPFTDVLIQAGNILDTAKKLVIYKDGSKLPSLRIEMQRFRTYLDEFYALAEFTHEDALAGNITKLSKRYEGLSYSDNAAQARADKA